MALLFEHALNTRLVKSNSQSAPHPPTPREALNFLSVAMEIAKFAGHQEARNALVLSVAGVTAIIHGANF